MWLPGRMGKTQYYTATSIDGFIADPQGSLDWLFEAAGDGHDERFPRFFAGVGAMIMGATTYEWVLAHERLLDEPGKWQQYYGEIPSWVLTHRSLPAVPGARLSFAAGDVRRVHEEAALAAGSRNVWLVGGGDLVGQFADQGLLDEIQLGVAPVTLGGGAPLLPRRLLAADLTLTAVEHDARFVYATYQVMHR
jgi:dihydrofolate reductase